MCGRFVLKTLDSIFDEFHVSPVDFKPSYNIAPTTAVPIVRADREGHNELALVHWGLIPAWAKDAAIGNKMINARVESLVEKPVFRGALQRRRCLVPADGFYEWKKTGASTAGGGGTGARGKGRGKGGGPKQPFYIHRRDGRLLAFAGLWERWRDAAGERVDSCTIITTPANEEIARLHDRMPAIVEPEEYERWLKSEEPAEEIRGMLGPLELGELEIYPVSTKVNRPGNDDPDCMMPVKADEPGDGEMPPGQGTLFP